MNVYGRRMRPLLLIAWLALVVHLVFFAPSEWPTSTLEMARRLTLFDWPEPSLCALWYSAGVLVFLHATFYLAARPQYKPHPLAVFVASPALGSVILLPYYALRRRDTARAPWTWPWKLLRIVLIVELIGFVAYGMLAGDMTVLWQEITRRHFSHFLFVDFVIMAVLLPFVAAGKLDR